jgi:festuclavine dehydrogenase
MYGPGIRDRGVITTAIPTGRVPFVATEDIAQAAFEGIVNKKNEAERLILLGPDTISFDEVRVCTSSVGSDLRSTQLASITSDVLGKEIAHRPVSAEEMVKFCLQFMTEDVAKWYVAAELGVEDGSEEKWATLSREDQRKLKVKVVVGKTSVKDWLLENKEAILETAT